MNLVIEAMMTEADIFAADALKILEENRGTPKREECNQLLNKELALRNTICILRSDSWRWTINDNRVLPNISKMKNDPEAMQRLADELKVKVELFKSLRTLDQVHRRAIEEAESRILIKNVKFRGSVICQLNKEKVRKIFRELGVSFDQVKKFQSRGGTDDSGTCPMEITLEDSQTAKHIIKQFKNQFNSRDAEEEWMKSVEMIPSPYASYLDSYIYAILQTEQHLRNKLSEQKGESCQWTVRSHKVLKHDENYVSHSHAPDNAPDSHVPDGVPDSKLPDGVPDSHVPDGVLCSHVPDDVTDSHVPDGQEKGLITKVDPGN